MKTIAIEGVIGWDVYAADIRAELKKAKGEDVDLLIHSPGGSVYEGIAVYNAIRDFKKDGGKITARVIGLAASMASYIPLAADKVVIEDNAVWMIHNPWSFAIGDQNDLRKTADILEGLSSILSAAYVKKTKKEKDEIKQMMDDETFLFGEEIISAGFADEIVPAGEGADDKDQAVALCKLALDDMKGKMQEEPEKQQLDKVAAMLKETNQNKADVIGNKAGVSGDSKTAANGGEKSQREVKGMTLDELKKENSAVYDEAVQAGVKAERERINALKAYVEADPENAKVAEVVNDAIATGKTVSDINAKLQVAIRDGGKIQGENPPDVKTDKKAEDDDEAIVKASIARLKKAGL